VPKACILGIGGTQLSGEERALFAATDPLGFILFDRNCRTPDQVKSLVAALREISGRNDAPILIDQEGGRVARLKPPHWRAAPAMAVFGRLHRADPDAAARATWLNARLLGAELHDLGINVDCAPVLDLPRSGADPIIGDRAFGTDAGTVAALGDVFIDGLNGAGVLAVIKHIPGHGRAGVDSHLQLPRVASPAAELAATDFAPFKALSGRPAPKPWAMTAHVVFEAIDPENPATLSASVIEGSIRGGIGFDGILISDDLSMDALSGPLAARARKAVTAGCDLNLHCNGKMEEMRDVARESSEISEAVWAKLALSLGALKDPEAFDPKEATQELDLLLAKAGITDR
jgi:beta-N-acetylhexosaminidase